MLEFLKLPFKNLLAMILQQCRSFTPMSIVKRFKRQRSETAEN
jgi:hypothetical protein